jgi:hypothetical protein
MKGTEYFDHRLHTKGWFAPANLMVQLEALKGHGNLRLKGGAPEESNVDE